MSTRGTGHSVVGGVSATLGVCLLAVGMTRPAALAGTWLHTPLWTIAITTGVVLVLSGALILLFTFRKPDEIAPEVPAHVAFNSRMTLPSLVPTPAPSGAGSPRAPATPADARLPSAPARLPAPAAAPQKRLAPIRDDIALIDTQIRDLTKKINKAGVMLATGQLSQQGYLAYVEDIKRQRGKLEAQRVRAELRT